MNAALPSKVTRRKAREDALQILYQLDLNQDLTPETGLFHFENHFSPDRTHGVDAFTQRLVTGVANNLKDLDNLIEAVSDHWRTNRMPAVDRNLLRLGTFELAYCDEVPATVTINEMIELAKQYGSENSAGFINGVLDKVRLANPRPHKAP